MAYIIARLICSQWIPTPVPDVLHLSVPHSPILHRTSTPSTRTAALTAQGTTTIMTFRLTLPPPTTSRQPLLRTRPYHHYARPAPPPNLHHLGLTYGHIRYHSLGFHFVLPTWHANWNRNSGPLVWDTAAKINLSPWLTVRMVCLILSNSTHSGI